MGSHSREVLTELEDIPGNSISGRGNSQDEGFEQRTCLEGARNRQAASDLGTK